MEATINNSKQFKWLNGYIENQIIVALKKWTRKVRNINVKKIIDKNSFKKNKIITTQLKLVRTFFLK